jgi:hypothetical protein
MRPFASIDTSHPSARRSTANVWIWLSASGTDTVFVVTTPILVDVRDGFELSAVWSFSASIGFVNPLPIVMSCFLECAIFGFPFTFEELDPPPLGYFLRLASIEQLVKRRQYRFCVACQYRIGRFSFRA